MFMCVSVHQQPPSCCCCCMCAGGQAGRQLGKYGQTRGWNEIFELNREREENIILESLFWEMYAAGGDHLLSLFTHQTHALSEEERRKVGERYARFSLSLSVLLLNYSGFKWEVKWNATFQYLHRMASPSSCNCYACCCCCSSFSPIKLSSPLSLSLLSSLLEASLS